MTNLLKAGLVAAAASGLLTLPLSAQITGKTAAGNKAPLSAAEKHFVLNSADTNLLEIKLGQLALRNASSNDVKSFAQRMINDHNQAQNSLGQVARAHNITLPIDLNAEGKKELTKLSSLKGKAFNTAYMSFNVPAHAKTLASMRNEEKHLTAADLKGWNTQTMPTVQQHLKMAEQTDRSIASESKHTKTGGASSSY